ncbi:MAG: HlyD family secretion protein [Anaerolineae bacterium]|nr:HlyD family secretion protein [Anaerolineae bacterium]
MKPKKLALIIGAVLVVVVLAGIAGNALTSGNMQGLPGATPTLAEEAATPVAELAVRARGEVIPALRATLSYQNSGRVVEWLVEEGQQIKAGQSLGRLDTTQLEIALREAEIKLAEAEAEHPRKLAEAEIALQNTEAQLSKERTDYPNITEAQVRLQQAIEAEADALEEFNKAKERMWEPDKVREGYEHAWEQARDDLVIAQANYESAQRSQASSSKGLQMRELDVEKARLELERLRAGVDPALTLAVERAKGELDAATLIAPFDGTVVELHLHAGDWAQPGQEAITLADLDSLQIETTDLDEWGITHISVGDPVTITFNAFDNKTLAGQITDIALKGEKLQTGDMVYKTTISLDNPSQDLRWGMTVRVTIPIEESEE